MTNQRSLKSVSFSPMTETHHIFEPVDDATSQSHHQQQTRKHEQWYSNEELLFMKYSSIKKALAVREDHTVKQQNLSSYSNTVLAAYLLCCGRSTALMAKTEHPTTTFEDVTNSDLHHTATLHRLANRLARATNPTWRGLEFHSVHTIRLERAKRRQCIRHAVLAVQEQHRQQQRDSKSCASASKTDSSLQERLRWVSEKGSMATTLFAHVLGLADALTAQQYYQQQQPEGDAVATVSALRCRKRARSQSTTLDTIPETRVCKTQVRIPSFGDASSSSNVHLSPSLPRGLILPAIAVKVL